MDHFTESQIFYRGVDAGKALCAAGPWQHPPAEPPHCDLLVESQNTPKLFYAVLWSTEHNYWNYSNGERINFEIHTSWKRWAVINEEKKP